MQVFRVNMKKITQSIIRYFLIYILNRKTESVVHLRIFWCCIVKLAHPIVSIYNYSAPNLDNPLLKIGKHQLDNFRCCLKMIWPKLQYWPYQDCLSLEHCLFICNFIRMNVVFKRNSVEIELFLTLRLFYDLGPQKPQILSL